MRCEVAIIGAGVAGLACAQVLRAAGKHVLVLDRSQGVGGRCATRRVEGQPVDHGVAFMHGRSDSFLQALRAVDAERVEGWPLRVRGSGAPCQPRAFGASEQRLAYREGVSVFPKALAAGLEIAAQTFVTKLEPSGDAIRLIADTRGQARELHARDVVLALAGAQACTLLQTLPTDAERSAALALLTQMPSVPCATVIAAYGATSAELEWDIWYPEQSELLQLLSHDSSKRRDPKLRVLVLQARPAWSRAHLAGPEGDWVALLLREAARLVGSFVERPRAVQAHRWRYARTGPENEFSLPLLLRTEGGARIGVAGELCAPGGGVEAAWLSGRRLAERLLQQA